MADVFLSYDSDDRDLAQAIVTHLEAQGWSVWWDRRIPAGKTWRAVLDKALEEMDCMLVLWSSRSIESHWVIEEAEEGRSRGKLLPVLIEPIRPPRGFREIQASSFVDWDRTAEAACFRTLLQDLAALTGQQPQPAASTRAAVAQYRSPLPPGEGLGVRGTDDTRDAPQKRKTADSSRQEPTPRHARSDAAPDVSAQQAGRSDAPADHGHPLAVSRKLAASVGIAAVALVSVIAFIGRGTETQSGSAPPVASPAPEVAPLQSPDSRSAGALVTPSSEPLVRPSGSLLAPLPPRDDASRPAGVQTRSLVGGDLNAMPRSAAMERRERELEERRKQRQAEIERKLREMKGTPSEIERERARLEIEALAEEQKEMTQALDEMHRSALDAIKSIKQ
jgi:hypothetical protein